VTLSAIDNNRHGLPSGRIGPPSGGGAPSSGGGEYLARLSSSVSSRARLRIWSAGAIGIPFHFPESSLGNLRLSRLTACPRHRSRRPAGEAMTVRSQAWAACALWMMLAISGGWALYLLGSHYGSCRTGGTGKFACFVIAFFHSCWDVLVLVVLTIAKFIALILP
jgi:hypothetical protein